MAKQKENAGSPNDSLPLDQFNYAELNGDKFEKYLQVFDKLLLQNKYDFEVWLATVQTKFRVNEDSGEKEEYVFGIQLNGSKPIEKTRITALQAREINNHVSKLKNNEVRSTSKYLLLVKPEPKAAKVESEVVNDLA